MKLLSDLSISPEAMEELATRMKGVEALLDQEVGSHIETVQEACAGTLGAGGKRLRPQLVICAALATGQPEEKSLTDTAACMELIHMATLMHDDVIDEAPTRRGAPTAAAQHGSTAAILSGDALLAKAMRLLAYDGHLPIIRMTSEAVVELAEGEVLEIEWRGDINLHEPEHRRILRLKTASFIECCCRSGAMLAGADPKQVQALGKFGHHIGIAFQIADDLLDYRGRGSDTGKIRAGDFREGCATLPLIHLMPALSDAERALVGGKFGNGVTDADLDLLVEWMENRGAFAATEEAAKAEVSEGLKALETLPESPYRDLLAQVSQFVVLRKA